MRRAHLPRRSVTHESARPEWSFPPLAGPAPAIFLPSNIFDLWLGASLGFWISVRPQSGPLGKDLVKTQAYRSLALAL
jgi:hypothetical protein